MAGTVLAVATSLRPNAVIVQYIRNLPGTVSTSLSGWKNKKGVASQYRNRKSFSRTCTGESGSQSRTKPLTLPTLVDSSMCAERTSPLRLRMARPAVVLRRALHSTTRSVWEDERQNVIDLVLFYHHLPSLLSFLCPYRFILLSIQQWRLH
jgi:hypothetical protein